MRPPPSPKQLPAHKGAFIYPWTFQRVISAAETLVNTERLFLTSHHSSRWNQNLKQTLEGLLEKKPSDLNMAVDRGSTGFNYKPRTVETYKSASQAAAQAETVAWKNTARNKKQIMVLFLLTLEEHCASFAQMFSGFCWTFFFSNQTNQFLTS